MPTLEEMCADLRAEHHDLDMLVGTLDEKEWDIPTPAEPWTIRDQISHLTYFDERAMLACDRSGRVPRVARRRRAGRDDRPSRRRDVRSRPRDGQARSC